MLRVWIHVYLGFYSVCAENVTDFSSFVDAADTVTVSRPIRHSPSQELVNLYGFDTNGRCKSVSGA